MKLNYTPNGDIEVTCTLAELIGYDSAGLRLYATPSADGRVAGLYWDSHPSFADDRAVATPDTFAHTQGWSSLGWQDSDWITGLEELELAIAIPLGIPAHPHAE